MARSAKMTITLEEDEVVLKVDEVVLRFTPFVAKEVGEKLFKAGCVMKDRLEEKQ